MGKESESLLEIEDRHFVYERNNVFNGINLKIPLGKVGAVLGMSGAGKG